MTVIGLQWFTDRLFRGRNILFYREINVGEKTIPISAPMVQDFGFTKKMKLLTEEYHAKRVCRTLKQLPQKLDVIYDHFWNNA